MRNSRIKALISPGMTVTACSRRTDSAPRRESTGGGKVPSGVAQRTGGAAGALIQPRSSWRARRSSCSSRMRARRSWRDTT